MNADQRGGRLIGDRYAVAFIGLGATVVLGGTAAAAAGPIAGIACGGLAGVVAGALWDNAAWVTAADRSPALQLETTDAAALRLLRARAVEVVVQGVNDVRALTHPDPLGLGSDRLPQDGRAVEGPTLVGRLPGVRIVGADGDLPGPTGRSAFPTAPPAALLLGPSTGGPSTLVGLSPSWADLVVRGAEQVSAAAETAAQVNGLGLGHGSTPPGPGHETPQPRRSMVPSG